MARSDIVVVVGNEDGAHHCAAELIQALTEVRLTCPPGGVTYWVGEAQGEKKIQGYSCEGPRPSLKKPQMLASNTAHLAPLLKRARYPEIE